MTAKKTKINHLNETLETIHFDGNIEVNNVQKVRNEYYQFSKENSDKQLEKLIKGGKQEGWMDNHVNNFYFERLMGDVKLYHSKWSINEVLQSDELIQFFINKTKHNEKVFNKDLVQNVKTAVRLGGKGVASKPTKFPLKESVRLLEKYTEHLEKDDKIYYDPCAGWGTRMISAVKCGMHYIGNDINTELIKQLNNLSTDIQNYSDKKIKIIEQGSEVFNDILVNTADIIMTSPPYFYLEEYSGANQVKRNSDYNEWLTNFVQPLMNNCFQYSRQGTYCLINVTNFKEYDLIGSFKEAGVNSGYKFIGMDSLKNIKRTNSKGGFNENQEDVLVFVKE